jgi:uncharacterized protein
MPTLPRLASLKRQPQIDTRSWYNQLMTDIDQPVTRRQDLTPEDILTLLRQHLPDLTSLYNIQYLGVFGSYIHGLADQDSDLDILVDFKTPPTLFQFVRLQNELSDLLGIPVDLVMKTTLKPKIGEQILAEVMPV